MCFFNLNRCLSMYTPDVKLQALVMAGVSTSRACSRRWQADTRRPSWICRRRREASKVHGSTAAGAGLASATKRAALRRVARSAAAVALPRFAEAADEEAARRRAPPTKRAAAARRRHWGSGEAAGVAPRATPGRPLVVVAASSATVGAGAKSEGKTRSIRVSAGGCTSLGADVTTVFCVCGVIRCGVLICRAGALHTTAIAVGLAALRALLPPRVTTRPEAEAASNSNAVPQPRPRRLPTIEPAALGPVLMGSRAATWAVIMGCTSCGAAGIVGCCATKAAPERVRAAATAAAKPAVAAKAARPPLELCRMATIALQGERPVQC